MNESHDLPFTHKLFQITGRSAANLLRCEGSLRDKILMNILTDRPCFVYCKALNTKDKLVHNVPNPTKILSKFLDQKGFTSAADVNPVGQ